MKKFFYSLLFMAMAIVSAVSFASCGSDDDDNVIEKPTKEAYLKYVAWLSNDVLELADVVTEGVNFSFNTPTTYRNVEGMQGTIELSGKEATEANFTISLKLKSNWKEILATKDEVVIASTEGQGNVKGSTVSADGNFHSSSLGRESAGDEFENRVSGLISVIEFKSK